MSASVVQLPTGPRPNWEVGEDETSLIEEKNTNGAEDMEIEPKELKSIPESLVLLLSLKQSRNMWLFNPPLTKFSVRSRSKNAMEIPQPPHDLNFLGRFDLEIGPLVFIDTKILEVQYIQAAMPPASLNGPVTPHNSPRRTDLIIEFKENSSERFILPLECAIIERMVENNRSVILLSTALSPPHPSSTSNEPAGDTVALTPPQQPMTLRFLQAGLMVWEAMERRVKSSSLSMKQVTDSLREAVESAPPRTFLAHRLPEGRLLDEVTEAASDKFGPKTIVLKELKVGPPPPVISTKRKAVAPTPAFAPASRPSNGTAENAEQAGDAPPKKKYERRIKVTCSSCGKPIARKAEDVGKENYKALCRPCGAEARRASREAGGSAPSSSRPNPRMSVEVVVPPLPSGYRRSTGYAGTSSVPLPAHWATSSAQNPPSSTYNLYSSRPPPLPTPGRPYLSPYTTQAPASSTGGQPGQAAPLPYPVHAISSPYPAPGNPYAYAYRQPSYTNAPPPVQSPYAGTPYGPQGYYGSSQWRPYYPPPTAATPSTSTSTSTSAPTPATAAAASTPTPAPLPPAAHPATSQQMAPRYTPLPPPTLRPIPMPSAAAETQSAKIPSTTKAGNSASAATSANQIGSKHSTEGQT